MLLQINQSEGSLNSILQTKDLQEYWYLLLLGAILGITIVWRLFKRKKNKHSLDSEVNPPASEYQEYQTYLEKKATLIAETTKPLPTSESTTKVSPSGKNESQPEPIAIKEAAKEPKKNEPTTKNIDDKIIVPKPSEVTSVVNISAKEQSVPFNIGYDPAKIVVNPGELTYPYMVLPKANAKVTLPQEGRTGRQGFKDADFKKYLSNAFSSVLHVDDNKLLLTNSGNTYSPDISLIDTSNGLNLFIDIEIDEPYEGTNDIENRKAIHYRGCDEIRNRAFVDSGWIVIRFAEIQVHQNPNGCCLFVADILSKVNTNFFVPNHLKSSEKIEQVSQWTKVDAEIFSKNRKREEYLGIESFGTVAETKIIFKTTPVIDKAPPNTALKTSKVENEIENRLNVTIPPEISKSIASEIKQLTIIPYKIGDKWSILDIHNNKLLNDTFDKCYFIDNSLQYSKDCIIVKNNKYAIVNSIMDFEKCTWYDSIKQTNIHNTFIVKINSKYGIVNNINVELLPLDYESIEEIESNGTTNVTKIFSNRKIGIFDIDMREIVLPCIYDDVLFYNEGVGGVKLNGRWRLYDLEYRKFIDKDEDLYTFLGFLKMDFLSV